MLTLSTASIIEKNKISSTGAWVMAIELHHPEGNILLVNNTEDLTLGGKQYTAFPFKRWKTSMRTRSRCLTLNFL